MSQTHSSAGIVQNPVLAAVQFRENDVFNFRYKPEEAKKRFEPYHCFDGTLVVKKYSDDKIYLVDTYWSSGIVELLPQMKLLKKVNLFFYVILMKWLTLRNGKHFTMTMLTL